MRFSTLMESKDLQIYTSKNEFIVHFFEEPNFVHQPLKTDAGVDIYPGQEVLQIKGHKTSAGYPKLDLCEGWSYRYLGLVYFCNSDGDTDELCIFEPLYKGVAMNKPLAPKNLFDEWKKYYFPCFVKMYIEGENLLFFSNKFSTGRYIETKVVKIK